jgi:iron complex outermembrane receptor protein
MLKRTRLSASLMAAMAAGAFGSLGTSVAFAQQQQQLDRVEVTGSNIRRTTVEGATPIQVITRDEIQKSGATSVFDLLNQVSTTGSGTFSETNTNLSSGGGAAGISLRGLGLSYTLTLINGRRVAPSGFGGATGVATFTDLNSIPLSAIDRIEVLKGSASAVYGADAVGGVINVILRRDLKGGEASLYGGMTSRSDGQEVRANAGYGIGDLATDKFNLLFTLDAYKRDRIRSVDRPYGKTADATTLDAELGVDSRSLTGNPGSFRTGTVSPTGVFTANGPWRAMPNCPTIDKIPVTPGATEDQYCVFNFLTFWDLVPQAQRVGLTVSGNFDVSSNLSLFATGVVNRNELTFNVAPTPLSVGVISATAPGNTLGQTYQYRYRITAGGPRVNEIQTDFMTLTAGAKGVVANLDWSAAVSSSKNDITSNGSGYADRTKIAEAQTRGLLLPYDFALNPAKEKAAADFIGASYTRKGSAKSNGIDGKIAGDLFDLPAGPLSFAAGVEFRTESITDKCETPACAAGNIDGANTTAAGGKRDINSQFVEFRGAVVKGLDLSLAVRRDAYSGKSDPNAAGEVFKGEYDKMVPQVGVEYRPMRQVLLRGVVGQGFKAPTLFEAYQARSESFNSGASWADQRRCPVTRAREDCGGTQVRNFRGGNAQLKPEESNNYTWGIVLEPVEGLSMSLDAWRIDLKETIGLPSVSRLLAREAANKGDPLVIRGAATAAETAAGIPGAIEYISLQYNNLGRTVLRGIDVDAEYKWRTAELGRFGVRAVMSYLDSYKAQSEPGAPLVEYIGTDDLPRFRMNTSFKWTTGPWEATWGYRFVGSYLHGFQATGRDKVRPEEYHDLSVSYTGIKKLTLNAGIRNVFDREPAFSNAESQSYSYSYGDPRGRSFWLSGTYKF